MSRNKVSRELTDKEVPMLGDIPEVVPDFLPRKTLLVDWVTTDLGTVVDEEVWMGFLEKRGPAWDV